MARANNNGLGSVLEILPRLFSRAIGPVHRGSHLGNAALADDHPLGAENQINRLQCCEQTNGAAACQR